MNEHVKLIGEDIFENRWCIFLEYWIVAILYLNTDELHLSIEFEGNMISQFNLDITTAEASTILKDWGIFNDN